MTLPQIGEHFVAAGILGWLLIVGGAFVADRVARAWRATDPARLACIARHPAGKGRDDFWDEWTREDAA